MSTSTDSEWWKIFVQGIGYIGGWIAVVIGWRVSWGHHVKRESRKELRDLVDRLVDLCHHTEREAIDFLTDSPQPGDQTRALHIRNDISRLSRAMSRLKTEKGFDCTAEVIAFRRAITGGDLDSSARKPLPPDAEALRLIGVASLNLVDKMESEFSRIVARAR